MEDLDETEVVPHQSLRSLNGRRFLAMFRERGSHLSIIELEIAHDNICRVSCLKKGEVIIVCPCPSGPIIHSVVVRPEDSPISPPKEPLIPVVEADNCTQHALTDENAQKYWPSVMANTAYHPRNPFPSLRLIRIGNTSIPPTMLM